MIRPALAVARREWRVQLGSALGWSVMAAFAALAGTVFAVAVFRGGAPATLRGTFIALGWAVMLVSPALSMRSVVEEHRSGTWASLAASPASFAAIVLGQVIALLGLLAVTVVVPVLAQLAALEWFARPDYMEAATAVLGLLLAGSAYLASGILMSALVGNQVAAYLLTVFLWLTWLALARSAPSILSGSAAYVGFAVDPLRRLDDFLLGLLDTGNVVFFSAVTAWFLLAAVVATARASLAARVAAWPRIAAGLLLASVAAAGAVGIADAPRVRVATDMTKSRSYTLADGTRELLGSLEGDWQVSVVLASPDAGVARQVDEVLAQLAACPTKGGRLRTVRVDPTDAADAARYESALEAVHTRDAAALARHDEAIRAGRAAFDHLTRVAAVQGPLLADLVTALAADDPSRAQLDSIRGGFVQLVTQKRAFDRSIDELRTATDARPFPDDARAAAAVSANLKHWSEELAAASRSLADRAARGVEQPALAAWLETAPMEFTSLARELRVAQDALDRLPRLVDLVGVVIGGVEERVHPETHMRNDVVEKHRQHGAEHREHADPNPRQARDEEDDHKGRRHQHRLPHIRLQQQKPDRHRVERERDRRPRTRRKPFPLSQKPGSEHDQRGLDDLRWLERRAPDADPPRRAFGLVPEHQQARHQEEADHEQHQAHPPRPDRIEQ